MRRPTTVLAMARDMPDRLFDFETRELLDVVATVDTRLVLTDFGTAPAIAALARAEVLLTSWGCPPIDETALAAAPHLSAIVHAAGSVKEHITPACWRRGIMVSTAASANALPVAEYTVAMILLTGKRVPEITREYGRRRERINVRVEYPDIGNYRRTVGVVGASRIGRRVIELLRPYDMQLLVADPHLDGPGAAGLGARLVELDALLAASDVITLHAPSTAATRHLIDRRRLGLIRDGRTVVNTARGALIDHAALVDELVAGRINAVIDTTEPDVLPADSPLYSLPNVVLTPHLAGAQGVEIQRLGSAAVEELARYAAGRPFAHPVLATELDRIA